jgi:LysM repeat protein
MRDYLRRFLIAIIMAICVSLLFLGGRHSQAAAAEEIKGKEHWIWPVDGVITDTYGTRHGNHKGIDIAGKMDTPILAVEDGQVVKSYYSTTYGNVIFIKHPSNFVTVYAHLSKRLASPGQYIKQGETIGKMGKTGHATGTHLHFEAHQLEWRYDKRFAFDPVMLLGKMAVGEAVVGGNAAMGRDVLEASAQLRPLLEEKTPAAVSERYKVKEGDTLSAISVKVNVSVTRIKELNRLKSDLIRPNQVLKIK